MNYTSIEASLLSAFGLFKLSEGGRKMSKIDGVKFRHGNCCATLLFNECEENGEVFRSETILLECSYEDIDGNVKTPNEFRVSDLASVITVLNQAHAFYQEG